MAAPAVAESNEAKQELQKHMTTPIIKCTDMPPEISCEAVDFIVTAIDKHQGNLEAAARHVKEQMDKKFGAPWHCIIGEGYSYSITHQQNHLMLVYYQGSLAALLFKHDRDFKIDPQMLETSGRKWWW